MLRVFVDADACPVKPEIYRVAKRYDLPVTLVANSRMRVPDNIQVELVVVRGDFDAADNWIVEHAGSGDVVVSADIPLAARCLERGARVLDPRGKEFTAESIGDALASRELLANLRDMGLTAGGPASPERKDRSRFAHKLDEIVQAIRRGADRS